jgi:hypothetical protein
MEDTDATAASGVGHIASASSNAGPSVRASAVRARADARRPGGPGAPRRPPPKGRGGLPNPDVIKDQDKWRKAVLALYAPKLQPDETLEVTATRAGLKKLGAQVAWPGTPKTDDSLLAMMFAPRVIIGQIRSADGDTRDLIARTRCDGWVSLRAPLPARPPKQPAPRRALTPSHASRGAVRGEAMRRKCGGHHGSRASP